MTPLPDYSIYLVPLGSGRFELYSEPPDDADPVEGSGAEEGFFTRQFHNLQEKWRETVHTARRREPSAGRFAQVRDWAVCRVAESIAEQRTLWSLRHASQATLVHQSNLSDAAAADRRTAMLARARHHHGRWLIGDGLLFVASGALMLIPGPNVIAYYFGFRLIGHYLSWCGAHQALEVTVWRARAEPALDELAALADVARDARASRVEAIAEALKLPRLAAFFDRAAVPAR
jgi:Mitochondrial K+-H+ exchange-related